MPKRRGLSRYESVSTRINTLIEDLNNSTILRKASLYIHDYIYRSLVDILNPSVNSEFIDITIKETLRAAIDEMVGSDEYEKADAAALKKIIMDYTLGIEGPMSHILEMVSDDRNKQNAIDILNVMRLQWKMESNRVRARGGRRRLRSRRRRTNRQNTRRRR